jgi:Cytochrome b5-like Heme/Steroid binding domain
MSAPDPTSLIKKNGDGGCIELPIVDQLGIISVETLNMYHCDNPERRLICMFGNVYDVTSSIENYGPDGSYKEYAGHDITLALSMNKTDLKWMDRFVRMDEKWTKAALGWSDFYATKYPLAGKLDVWESANAENWPELSTEDREEFEKGCTIM